MAMPTLSAPSAESRPYDADTTACFSVQANADPGVMSRVLELFAKRGLVPTSWHSRVGGIRGDELIIDLQMHGMVPSEAEFVAACLRQIPDVDSVLTSERFRAAAE
ncbi:hypothetical protein N825_05870 [Skermanella stibiiresistens SB22]|jgi:acetolactate synthase small subunit|uniref:ACT domain-containing protein n=1 Tax=Skermanella stibiiresistens SB22 TaxID=1385369 RepID=W9H4J7_9PROT|nr:hypothetical protein [Skermanella stibiiresistens]EWY39612.1 hypothetical protein N825_05870 [Skermanella stibiiresistens SB22]